MHIVSATSKSRPGGVEELAPHPSKTVNAGLQVAIPEQDGD